LKMFFCLEFGDQEMHSVKGNVPQLHGHI
jgi:hypothetical protein